VPVSDKDKWDVSAGDKFVAYRLIEDFGKGLLKPDPLPIIIKGIVLSEPSASGSFTAEIKTFNLINSRMSEVEVYSIYKDLDNKIINKKPYQVSLVDWVIINGDYLTDMLDDMENM